MPIRWSRLPAIENLLGSSDDNFRFVRQITIKTRQDPLSDDERDIESLTDSEAEMEKKLLALPSVAVSRALNVLIRLLIPKLPTQRLEVFWYTG